MVDPLCSMASPNLINHSNTHASKPGTLFTLESGAPTMILSAHDGTGVVLQHYLDCGCGLISRKVDKIKGRGFDPCLFPDAFGLWRCIDLFVPERFTKWDQHRSRTFILRILFAEVFRKIIFFELNGGQHVGSGHDSKE